MSKSRSRMGSFGAWSRSRRLIVALVVLACASIVAVSVRQWLSGDIGGIGSSRSVRGILIDVQGMSIVFAESVTLRSDDGAIHEFRVDPEVATNREEPQSASHLRQHMVLGEPVIVRYRVTAEGPLAVRIVDGD